MRRSSTADEDAALALKARQLTSRALYLEGPDRAAVAAGAFLVELPGETALAALGELVGDRPAVVFWSWPDGSGAMYDHLRRRTLMEIPLKGGVRSALFRFGDSHVVANVLGVLTSRQLAAFCGPGGAVVAPVSGRAWYFAAPPDTPPTRGRLRLSIEQYAAVEARYTQQLRLRAHAYFAPHLLEPPAAAAARVDDALMRAEGYRLDTPDAA